MTTSEPTEKTCARCQAPLFLATHGDFSLHGCGRCGGVWLGREAAADVMTGKVSSAAILASKLAASTKLDPTLLAHDASCPECAKPLIQATVLGTALDVCATHGVWFDRGELEAVMKAATPTLTVPPLRSMSPRAARECYPWLARYAKLCRLVAILVGIAGVLMLFAQMGLLNAKDQFSWVGVLMVLLTTGAAIVSILGTGDAAVALLDLLDRPIVR